MTIRFFRLDQFGSADRLILIAGTAHIAQPIAHPLALAPVRIILTYL
jgi:hypothetical protein